MNNTPGAVLLFQVRYWATSVLINALLVIKLVLFLESDDSSAIYEPEQMGDWSFVRMLPLMSR